MDLLESLNWRYATKKFSEKKLSPENLHTIIEAINLSASSLGIQPYRLLVVEDKKIREELGIAAFNSQVKEASHLLVFAAYDRVNKHHIEEYINRIAQVRETPKESLADFKDSIENYLLSRTDEQNFIWSTKQAYIALGTGLIAAANLQVDATPMEGFDAEKLDKILKLKEKGLKSVVLLALGYRDEENDTFSKLKKVRLPQEEFVSEII